jgi:hypothetical protein
MLLPSQTQAIMLPDNIFGAELFPGITAIGFAGTTTRHAATTGGCVRQQHLRPASNEQNNENLSGAQRNSKSGVRGVRWDSRCQCWRAVVQHQGKFHERRCATIELAEAWVVAKRNELFTRVKT